MHPANQITLGSQIVVNESQEALLFENGQLISALGPGRHLVESGNIPGLEGILSRAFGGESPAFVQVWFINKIATFDYKWGVQIQVRDSAYDLLVPLGARGNYALRLKDPASFILQMVGVSSSFSTEEARTSFLPLVERTLKGYLASEVVDGGLDIYTISSKLKSVSLGITKSLSVEVARFGFELVDFYVQAIDVLSDDPAFRALKEGLAQAATLRIRAAAAADVGSFYQLERSLDALNKAASNEGGPAGALLAGGLGVGLGVGVGQSMGQSVSSQSALPNQQIFNSSGPDIAEKLSSLKQLFDSGLITSDDYDLKKKQILDLL
jgi:membrane protease subunit (stomatin/prohibitin family)